MTETAPFISPDAATLEGLAAVRDSLRQLASFNDSDLRERILAFVVDTNRIELGRPLNRPERKRIENRIKPGMGMAVPLYRQLLAETLDVLDVYTGTSTLTGQDRARIESKIADEQAKLPNGYTGKLMPGGDDAGAHIRAHFGVIRNGALVTMDRMYGEKFRKDKSAGLAADYVVVVVDTQTYPAAYGLSYGNAVINAITDKVQSDLTGTKLDEVWAAQMRAGMRAPGTSLVDPSLLQGPGPGVKAN